MKCAIYTNKAIAMTVMVLAGLTIAKVAVADDSSPWYVGLSVGQSNYRSGLTNDPEFGIYSSSKTSTGYSLMLGYRVNQYFSMEENYFNMGNATVINTTITMPMSEHINAGVRMTGVGLDAIGSLPLTQTWSLFGRLGIITANVTDNSSTSFMGGSGSVTSSANNTTYDVGAGVQLNANRNWAFRLGYTQYHNVVEHIPSGSPNVDYTYLSALYNF